MLYLYVGNNEIMFYNKMLFKIMDTVPVIFPHSFPWLFSLSFWKCDFNAFVCFLMYFSTIFSHDGSLYCQDIQPWFYHRFMLDSGSFSSKNFFPWICSSLLAESVKMKGDHFSNFCYSFLRASTNPMRPIKENIA